MIKEFYYNEYDRVGDGRNREKDRQGRLLEKQQSESERGCNLSVLHRRPLKKAVAA